MDGWGGYDDAIHTSLVSFFIVNIKSKNESRFPIIFAEAITKEDDLSFVIYIKPSDG